MILKSIEDLEKLKFNIVMFDGRVEMSNYTLHIIKNSFKHLFDELNMYKDESKKIPDICFYKINGSVCSIDGSTCTKICPELSKEKIDNV